MEIITKPCVLIHEKFNVEYKYYNSIAETRVHWQPLYPKTTRLALNELR